MKDLPQDRKVISHQDYDEAGGAKGVLQSYVERILGRLPQKDRRPARVIIEGLVRADQTRDVRTTESLSSELKALDVEVDNFEGLLTTLRENHVLRIVDTDAGLAYELVHDYLAQQVQVDPETAARKAAQELLDRRVGDYLSIGSLLTHEELDVISAQSERLHLDDNAKKLIGLTRRTFRRQRQIAIGLTAATILGVIGVLVIGILAVRNESQNRQERIEQAQTSEAEVSAERDAAWITESRMFADLANQQFNVDPMASLNLSLEALTPRERPYVLEAEYALARSVQLINERLYLPSEARVHDAVWNQDESQIMTWSNDGTVRIYDAETGAELLVISEETPVLSATWSSDESQILTGRTNGLVTIYDLMGTILSTVVLAPDAEPTVTSVRWLEATGIFIASSDTFTGVWDSDGEEIAQMQGGLAVLSPDQRQIATIDGSIVYVWEIATGEQVVEAAVHNNSVNGIQWNNEGTQILSWGNDGSTLIWDATTAETIASFTEDNLSLVTGAAWSPNENQIALVGNHNQLSVWDIESSDLIWRSDLQDSTADSVLWNQDGTQLLAYGNNGLLGIWEAVTGETVHRLSAPTLGTNKIEFADWSPNYTYVFGHANNGIAYVWDAETGNLINQLAGHNARIRGVTWRSDENATLTAGDDGSARLWVLVDNGIPVGHGEIAYYATESEVEITTWNDDENLIASGQADGSVILWDIETGEMLHTWAAHSDQVTELAWSPSQTQIASGGDDGRVIVWDINSDEAVTILPHEGAILSVVWNKDGQWLLTGSDDGIVRIWDIETSETIFSQQQSESQIAVSHAIFNQDETKILASSDDGIVRIWNIETG